jgi:O2-independent ubiquinone biosynthesis protein UbiV
VKLTLGPILPFWDRPAVFDFYAEAADWPIDCVYLGEVVCSKRRKLDLDDWLEIAALLHRAGKKVVLSTLALIEAESELATLRHIVGQEPYCVEANSLAAVYARAGRPFVIGPHINVYNAETLAVLRECGARRFAPPLEVGAATLQKLRAAHPDLPVEVFAFGRMPLAFSARCFTARAHNVSKDDCGFVCGQYPEGLPLDTREGEHFLVANGVQTQSARTHCLLGSVAELEAQGIDYLRLSPQSVGMTEIVHAFHAVIEGREAAGAAEARLLPLMPAGACDGYWHGRAGMAGHPVAAGAS